MFEEDFLGFVCVIGLLIFFAIFVYGLVEIIGKVF